jgi:hypothetical protein
MGSLEKKKMFLLIELKIIMKCNMKYIAIKSMLKYFDLIFKSYEAGLTFLALFLIKPLLWDF